MKDIFFSNLLCVIDTETTGLNPDIHEIVDFAIIPLGKDLQPHEHYAPLNIWMSPTNIDSIDPESLKISGRTLDECLTGLDPGLAADLFLEWYENLHLPLGSRIIPVACNWMFDSQYIRNWLDREPFDRIFHGHVRDVMSMALCLDDLAWAYDEDLPYPRLRLREMCTTAGIEVPDGPHGAMVDAQMTMKLYKHLCFNRGLTRNQLGGSGV